MLDSLAEEQSRFESGVTRVRTVNREERDATTCFVAKERFEALRRDDVRKGKAASGTVPGPGEYNSNHIDGKRATGGLIQPLPKHRSRTYRADKCESLNAKLHQNRTLRGNTGPTAQILDVVRPRVLGGLLSKAPTDKVLEAVARAEALRKEGEEPRPEDLPSTMDVLSRACSKKGIGGIDGGSNSGLSRIALKTGRLVFTAARDGRVMVLSTNRSSSSSGTAQYSVVLSKERSMGGDATRGVVALVPVGSAVVLRFLGKFDVYGTSNMLVGKRPAANNRGSLFAAEIPSVPAPGRAVLVVLRNIETGKYISRACVANIDSIDSGNTDAMSSQTKNAEGIEVGCFSDELGSAERFIVDIHSPEPGAYNVKKALHATRKKSPGCGFGSSKGRSDSTPRKKGCDDPCTPTTEKKASAATNAGNKILSSPSSLLLDKNVRGASFGKSKSKRGTTLDDSVNSGLLEDEDLLEWLKFGRGRKVILGLPMVDGGVVVTAPTSKGAAVHARDRWPGTGNAVLTFRYIPHSTERQKEFAKNKKPSENLSAEFSIRTERGLYFRMRQSDGVVCVSKDPPASDNNDDSIGFRVTVHGKFISIVGCSSKLSQALHISSNDSGRVLRVDTEAHSKVLKDKVTLFKVHTNTRGGSYCSNTGLDGFAAIKPRTRGGRWTTPMQSKTPKLSSTCTTPITPNNMEVPSEGAPTPGISSWTEFEDSDDGDSDIEDFDSDEMNFDDGDSSDGNAVDELNSQPPPEMPDIDIDRLVKPRIPGVAWSKPSENSNSTSRARKRKLQSMGATPGPGQYDTQRFLHKIQKRTSSGGAIAFGETLKKSSTSAKSSAIRRRKAQREREKSALGPGTYDTSVARGSSALDIEGGNSAVAQKGKFARSSRFPEKKLKRKKRRSGTSNVAGAYQDDGAESVNNEHLLNDKTGVDEGRDSKYNLLMTDLNELNAARYRYTHYSSDEYSLSASDGQLSDSWSELDRSHLWQTDEGKRGDREQKDQYYARDDEGKREHPKDMYESKMDDVQHDSRERNRNTKRLKEMQKSTLKAVQKGKSDEKRQLPSGLDLEDLLEEDGAASAMLAAPDLNISAVKPRVKGTTWGHKSVAKNWKNYHALRRAKRRKQREKEIGPTHYDAEKAREALVDRRVKGGPDFKKEEASRKQSKKLSRRARSKQEVNERRRLRELISKNPSLEGLEPGAILESQLHEDWSARWTTANKPVFEYREPEPLKSPARRAKAAREREKLGPSRWLSTQLPDDWLGGEDGQEEASKSGTTRFDLQLGRDRVRIKKGGKIVRERFDAPPRMGLDPLGPGHYEEAIRQGDRIDPLARVADRGIMSWSKRPGRKDSVGPFGERPEAMAEMDAENMEGQILDLSDANLERPNRKSAQVFTWRESDKWDNINSENDVAGGVSDEERLLLSPKDDFSRPRQKGGIRFDQQTGRNNGGAGNEHDDAVGGATEWEEDELQLDPRLTPIEKRKDIGHVFSDRPRFEERRGQDDGDGNDYSGYDDGELLLSPKEDFFRPRSQAGVDMSKQGSRGLTSPMNGPEDDFADHNLYQNAEYDVESALDRLKGGRIGSGDHGGVQFSKQRPRFEEPGIGSDSFVEDKEGHALLLSPKEFDSRKKRSQPARDWGKARPRFSPSPAEEAEYMGKGNSDWVNEEPALDLNPVDNAISNRAGKTGKGGVPMHKTKPRWSPPPDRSGHAADASDDGDTLLLDPIASKSAMQRKGRISPAGWAKQRGRVEETTSARTDTSHLVYENVDPDFGKRGASRSKNSKRKGGKDEWSKRKGRSPKPIERDMDALGLGVERLILSPDDALVRSSKSKGSVSMSSTTGRSGIAGLGTSRGVDRGVEGGGSIYTDGDILKIDPNEYEDKRKSHVGGVSMSSTMTVPRKALGKPPRPPRSNIKSRTLAGIKRTKRKQKKVKMTPAQRLLHVARQQHLQTEEQLVQEALAAWD